MRGIRWVSSFLRINTALEYLPLSTKPDAATYSASRDEDDRGIIGGSSHAPDNGIVADEPILFKTSNPFFVQGLEYTREEEARVIRILDTRLLPWVLLTT